MEVSVKDNQVAPELYFLIAKFLSEGPLKETFKTLLKDLENNKVLPKRLDWLGNYHEQNFEELCRRFQDVPSSHLLDLCKNLLKVGERQPSRSLLSRKAAGLDIDIKWSSENVAKRVIWRESGLLNSRPSPATPTANTNLLSHRIFKQLGMQRRTLGHLSAVYCVLYDRTGSYIITGADDLLVKMWSARDGRLLMTLRGAASEITDLAVSSDNRLLAAGSLDKLIRIWEMTTAAPVAVLQGHSGMITSVKFCPARSGDLRCLASTSTDGSVAFWTYQQCGVDGKPNFLSKPVQYMERMRPGVCHMICCCWSAGGTFLAAGSADHHVRLYMMAESGPKRVLEVAAHTDAVDSLAWAHRGLRLISGSKDGTAILWQLHATQWRHTVLQMSDGSSSVDDSKKIKVTMVCWDCTDCYVITAVNDHSIKVWCANTCTLVRTLRGHTDEAYVLEPHPFMSRVVLSAGHDGQLFLWDIVSGEQLTSFVNHIPGQGDGAVFDAKWSPSGVSLAATDSHGHIMLWGIGGGDPLFYKLPLELFFHTDYRPVTRDALGGVLDEQSGQQPHMLPPPFLVDVEGAPHPPRLQRLVPGRERAAPDQLVPITDNDIGNNVVPRSQLDMMIEELAYRQFGDNLNQQNNDHEEDDTQREQRLLNGRREGVRDTGSGWRSEGAPLLHTAALVPPLTEYHHSIHSEELTDMEMQWYRREMRRRPVMISTATGNGRPSGPGHAKRGRRRCNNTTTTPAHRKPPRPAQQAVHEMEEEDEDDEESLADTPHTSDSSVQLSQHSSSDEHSGTNNTKSSRSSSSSEYSDWVADKRNNALEPPARSRRRRVARRTYSPSETKQTRVRKAAAQVDTSSELNHNADDEQGTSASVSAPTVELKEIYRPSEWLCATQPRKAPYYPQMGDECYYFKIGHQKYFEAVMDKNIYKVNPRDMPWQRTHINECELVKVVGIKYMIKPPRLVCLKLACMPRANRSFTVRYHDMPDVIDFLLLKQQYDVAVARDWKPGDRFRCMIDDMWWTGTISSRDYSGTSSEATGDASQFLGLRVVWDNGEAERMSPWDLEPIDETRMPTEPSASCPVLRSELEAVLYRPQPGEWPHDNREVATPHILRAIDQVMSLSIAEPFVAPVDLNVYPTYAYIVEYPIDLSTIRSRFENLYYRRAAAAQFDVRYLATNAEKFNRAHTRIVRQARLVTDILLHIISHWWEVDVNAVYKQLNDTYKSSDSETYNKDMNLGQDWREACGQLMRQLMFSPDAEPFLQPVSLEQAPDYLSVITRPMDLGSVSGRLQSGYHTTPEQFADEVRLVFSNSKLYNTNKRSRIYSMTIRLSKLFEELFEKAQRCWKMRRRRRRRKHNTQTSRSMDPPASEYATSDDETLAAASRRVHATTTTSSIKGKGRGKRSKAPDTSVSPVAGCSGELVIPDVIPYGATINNGDKDWTDDEHHTDSESEDHEQVEVLEEEVLDEEVEVTYKSSGEESYHPPERHEVRPRKRRRRRRRGDDVVCSKSQKSETDEDDAERHFRARRRNKRARESILKSASPSSSVDTDSVDNMVVGSRHYESDRSYKPRADSDEDIPLNELKQNGGGTVSSDGAGPSQPRRPANVRQVQLCSQRGRRRRRAAAVHRPRYNEDSEEDSIAAISKRLRDHTNNRRSLPRPIVRSSYVNGHSTQNNAAAENSEQEDNIPLLVSSRGRVRKLTAKARGLFRD